MTEREEAARARIMRTLRESERMFRIVSENSRDIICLHDADHRYIYVSPSCKEILGYDPEELVGTNPWELVHPEDLEALQNTGQEKAEKGEPVFLSCRIRKKSGEYIWVESVSRLLEDDKGGTLGFVTSSRDVTERKRYEEEIEHLNLTLRAIRNVNQLISREKDRDKLIKKSCALLIESQSYSNAWLVLLDESGKFESYAEAGWGDDFTPLLERLKTGKIPACGQKALVQDSAVMTKKPASSCAGCPLSDRPNSDSALTIRLERGGKVYGLLSASIPAALVKDEEIALFEECAGDLALALHDIEIEKQRDMAEEALRESEERFRRVSSVTSDIAYSCVTNEDGVYSIDWMAGAVEQVTGYTVGEIKAQTCWRFLVMDEDMPLFEKHVIGLPQGQSGSCELRIRHKNGDTIWVASQAQCAPNAKIPSRSRLYGGLVNITERKKAEQALSERYKELNCLHNIEMISARTELNEQELCQEVVKILPASWQYPEIACCRVTINDREFKTENYRDTAWKQSADIVAQGAKVGVVEVCYLEEKPQLDEGPFMKEERALIDSVAKHIAGSIEGKKAAQALRESEQKYRTFFETSRDCVFITSREGRWIDCNQAAVELFGYESRDETMKVRVPDLYENPDDRKKHTQLIEQQGFVKDFEVNLRKKDGNIINALITSVVRRDEEGNVLGYQGIIKDITERKRAEEQYKLLAENAADIIYRLRLQDERFIYVSPSVERILGYTSEEALFLKSEDMLTAESYAKQEYVMLRDFQSGIAHRALELEVLHKDGSIIPVEVNAQLVSDEKGQPVEIVGVVRDITERKRGEQALKEAEERYRAIVELGDRTGEAVVMLRDDERGEGMHVFASETWRRITGYSEEELLHMSMVDLIHRRDRAAAVERHGRRIRGEVLPNLFEISIIRKDGTEVPVEVTYASSHYRGKPVNVGFIRDISGRKKMEEAVQMRATLLNSASDSIMAADLEGNIVYVNDTACLVRGYTRDEMLKMHLRDTVTPRQTGLVEERMKRALAEGDVNFESEHIRKDGSTFLVEIRARAVKVGERNLILSISRDITGRKKMEEQLLVTDRLVSIGEMASGIAHEMNNPLTGVIGLSDLLLARGDVPDDIKEDLKMINKEAHRTARIVKNLLTFARKHPEEKKPVELNSVIGMVLELRAYEQRVQNIQIITRFAPDLPPVMANTFQLMQVFVNLVINAEYFMLESHGGGTLTITTGQSGNFVRASFADDGPGIPPEILGKIFNPFFTVKEVGKGTGLGLSLCHGVITEHGGRIWAESEAGKGATFIIELPVSNAKAEE